MPSKPTELKGLKVGMGEDGQVSLSGINYRDLESILVMASLYLHANPSKTRVLRGTGMDDVVHANNVDDAQSDLWNRMVLNVLRGHVDVAKMRPGSTSVGGEVADNALKTYRHAMSGLDASVVAAEHLAAKQAAGRVEVVDPLAEASRDMGSALRAANAAMARLEQARVAAQKIAETAQAKPDDDNTQPGTGLDI